MLAIAGFAVLVAPTPVARDGVSLPTAPRTMVTFSVGLAVDRARLARYVAREHSRSHALPTLTPAAVGARFGLPLATIARLERELERHGIHIVERYPQRTALRVAGRAGAVERFLGIHFRDVPGAAGTRRQVAISPSSVPSSIRRSVAGISLLDSRSARPLFLHGISPTLGRTAYGVDALHRAQIVGQGQSIAVLSYAAFDPDAVKRFDRRFQITGPTPKLVKLDANACSYPTRDEWCAAGAGETNLDVQVIRGVAPKAQITVYEVSGDSVGLWNQFAKGKELVGSYSWGACSSDLQAASRFDAGQQRDALMAGATAGHTLFVSSGDEGAYNCQRWHFDDHEPDVSWPADDPSVVAVGGTLLDVNQDGSYQSEAAWVGPLSYSGTGGGKSEEEKRPDWQQGFVPDPMRGVPDVAAAASPTTGFRIFDSGEENQVGGTSAAAPFWAAATLLVQQYAKKQGVEARCFTAPLLYAIAGQKWANPPFHDVTVGTNRLYPATNGWDYTTGLGSPNVYNLARDLVAYLKKNPSACTHA